MAAISNRVVRRFMTGTSFDYNMAGYHNHRHIRNATPPGLFADPVDPGVRIIKRRIERQ